MFQKKSQEQPLSDVMKDNNVKTITKGKQLVISPVLMAEWLDIKEVIVISTNLQNLLLE